MCSKFDLNVTMIRIKLDPLGSGVEQFPDIHVALGSIPSTQN